MVGIFSRFSSRSGHRRTQSAANVRERAQSLEVNIPIPVSTTHGFEVAVEFKPVEHPIEPLNHDQPVRCPMPEPSILNDGRIWKERMTSVSARMRIELPVVKEGSQLSPEAAVAKTPRSTPRRAILPSVSAPEGNLINLLEEYNEAKDQNAEGGSKT
ncbi:uncharacterized protein LOC110116318 [Dendrobium catenatum]|uniref:Uncharacterized protein n=1 Tax=Dendrobium nobile TaxID=94219 RepID=A0A8T3A3F6_DENNO|nr:uncharacterized protein LOC110116318 [Dendrobium catenatum]KAI0489245.1 hypothetical protein KFK09_029087 [Dendrobium nobile]